MEVLLDLVQRMGEDGRGDDCRERQAKKQASLHGHDLTLGRGDSDPRL
jgi:hypothetical protein